MVKREYQDFMRGRLMQAREGIAVFELHICDAACLFEETKVGLCQASAYLEFSSGELLKLCITD